MTNFELKIKLMEHCNHYDLTGEDFQHYEDVGYLAEIDGRDGNTYYWYSDECYNAAINIATGEIIDDDKLIEDLFC